MPMQMAQTRVMQVDSWWGRACGGMTQQSGEGIGGGEGRGGITEQVPPSVQSDSGGHLVNASPCLRAALAASAQSSQP